MIYLQKKIIAIAELSDITLEWKTPSKDYSPLPSPFSSPSTPHTIQEITFKTSDGVTAVLKRPVGKQSPLKKTLGDGAVGSIRGGGTITFYPTDKPCFEIPVAIKKISKRHLARIGPETKQKLIQAQMAKNKSEMSVCQKIARSNHPGKEFVIEVLACLEDTRNGKENALLIMQEGQEDFFSRITRDTPQDKVDTSQKRSNIQKLEIIQKILKGLLACSEVGGIFPLDLKPENIIMFEDTPKLCDLSDSATSNSYKFASTPTYCSPEMAQHITYNSKTPFRETDLPKILSCVAGILLHNCMKKTEFYDTKTRHFGIVFDIENPTRAQYETFLSKITRTQYASFHTSKFRTAQPGTIDNIIKNMTLPNLQERWNLSEAITAIGEVISQLQTAPERPLHTRFSNTNSNEDDESLKVNTPPKSLISRAGNTLITTLRFCIKISFITGFFIGFRPVVNFWKSILLLLIKSGIKTGKLVTEISQSISPRQN